MKGPVVRHGSPEEPPRGEPKWTVIRSGLNCPTCLSFGERFAVVRELHAAQPW